MAHASAAGGGSVEVVTTRVVGGAALVDVEIGAVVAGADVVVESGAVVVGAVVGGTVVVEAGTGRSTTARRTGDSGVCACVAHTGSA